MQLAGEPTQTRPAVLRQASCRRGCTNPPGLLRCRQPHGTNPAPIRIYLSPATHAMQRSRWRLQKSPSRVAVLLLVAARTGAEARQGQARPAGPSRPVCACAAASLAPVQCAAATDPKKCHCRVCC